jgi:hypothetical protein
MIQKNRIFKRIFIICVLLTSCDTKQEELREFNPHPLYSLTGKQTGYTSYNELQAFGVQLDLTTPYDSLPPLYFMSCSWTNKLGHSSDSTFIVGYHKCDANFQAYNRISSQDTLRFLAVVVYMGDQNLKNSEIRIGISLIDTVMVSPMDSLFNENFERKLIFKDPEHIVWSNPIKLTKLIKTINHYGSVSVIRGNPEIRDNCW